MTTEVAEAGEIADGGMPEGPRCCGHVIVEWPPVRRDQPRPLAAWGCAIFDAETGEPIATAGKITIPAVTADVRDFITCELTMFADRDGMPVLFPDGAGKFAVWTDDDGSIRTGTFRFYVAGMRVRQ